MSQAAVAIHPVAMIQEKVFRLEALGGAAELQALDLVLTERIRQIEQEDWSPIHDDRERREGQLAAAASCYALEVHHNALTHARSGRLDVKPSAAHPCWPFSRLTWKPASIRRNAVKGTALLLAELAREVRAGLR